MYLWEICLGIIVCMLPIGIGLRKYVDDVIGNYLSWTKNAKVIFKRVKEQNSFVWFLLCVEGVISNTALFVLIISIPVYFIWNV